MLITLFSVKRTPWREEPDKWQRFREYCIRDTDVEEQLLRWCLGWLDRPWMRESVWAIHRQNLIYRRINRRGLPVDLPAVRGALKIRDQEKENLMDELRRITGLDNPNSRDQLLGWLRSRGARVDDIQTGVLQLAFQVCQTTRDAAPRWEILLNRCDN